MHSFMRADRLKDEGLAQEAESLKDKYAESMSAEPAVSLSDIFTARQGENDWCRVCFSYRYKFGVESMSFNFALFVGSGPGCLEQQIDQREQICGQREAAEHWCGAQSWWDSKQSSA